MSRTRHARPNGPAHARGVETVPDEIREAQPAATPDTSDQRRGPRRRPRSDRAAALPAGSATARNWIPPRWPYLILTMLAAIGSGMVATRSVPDPLILGMLGLAVLAVALVGPVHVYVANRRLKPRLAALVLVVVLPMFLFGLAVTRWTASGSLPWDVAIASLLCVAGVAAAYLRRQPGVIFAAQLSVWSAAVLNHASIAGAMTVLVALAVAILVSREQNREQRMEEERR